MQGARGIPVQFGCTQGQVAIGLNRNTAPATRSGGQTVSTLGFQGPCNRYASAFEADGSTGTGSTTFGVLGGSISPIGEDFTSGSDGEHTISMGKKFHRSTTGTSPIGISTPTAGTTE